MKLRKALRGYYKEQVSAVNIAGGAWKAKPNGRGAGSRMFNIAFHAVLIGLILTAIISGRYQTSHLGDMMFQVTERYNINDRLVNSLESLIQVIKKSKSAGGSL